MLDRDSQRFARTRDAHRAELAEDYVETILDLIEEDGDAKLTELSNRLGVTHPSAFKALRKLEAEGLVVLRPYKSILLTPKGQELALACRHRHMRVVAFLTALGVDRETAEIDAEGIEHHVSPRTLELMVAFVKDRE